MIPSTSHPLWAKLIKGDAKASFSQAAAGMLLGSLQRDYKKDPSKLPQQIQQAHEFFVKYERTLSADIQKLFG